MRVLRARGRQLRRPFCPDPFSVRSEKFFGGCFGGREVSHEDTDRHGKEITQLDSDRGQHEGEHADGPALLACQGIGDPSEYEFRRDQRIYLEISTKQHSTDAAGDDEAPHQRLPISFPAEVGPLSCFSKNTVATCCSLSIGQTTDTLDS